MAATVVDHQRQPRLDLGNSTRDDPDGVNDAWNVAQDRQQDVEPELPAQPNGEEHPDRRQQNGKQDAQKIGHGNAGNERETPEWLEAISSVKKNTIEEGQGTFKKLNPLPSEGKGHTFESCRVRHQLQ